MSEKFLAKITTSTELYEIAPLQCFIKKLAEHFGVQKDKLLHIEVIVEEIFVGISNHALNNDENATIEVGISNRPGQLLIRFDFYGVPYGYDIDHPEDEQSMLSMSIIHALCSSFKVDYRGKSGQSITLTIDIDMPEPECSDVEKLNTKELATDEVTLRRITDDDMESLVQCLYYVFGYSYSAADMYNADAIRQKHRDGLYEGFVAVNSKGKIVAHAGMLKSKASDVISECGQAFVMSQYAKRRLFFTLKQNLLNYAHECGQYGVFSNAITGHPYSQRVNVELGCVETALELGYVPNSVESMIKRKGEGDRQSTMFYFKPTDKGNSQTIYVPQCHADIVKENYHRLGLDRKVEIADSSAALNYPHSVIETNFNTVWGQVIISISQYSSQDFVKSVEAILRQAMGVGAEVAYFRVPITSGQAPAIISTLQKECGFFYSGITPYSGKNGDEMKMQCLLSCDIKKEDVVTASNWGNTLKEYVFTEKSKWQY